MTLNQIDELKEALARGTDRSLELEFSENRLTLRKSNDMLDYSWWSVLIIGIPIYYLWNNPPIQVYIIILFLSFCFAYLVFDDLLATNNLTIDLTNKILTIKPNNKICKFLGLTKEKVIGFHEVQEISLTQKSNGRGQPPGRRLFIDTIHTKTFTAIDFMNTSSAELFYRLLNDILRN